MEGWRWNLAPHPTISHNSNEYVLLYRFEILREAWASMPFFVYNREQSKMRWYSMTYYAAPLGIQFFNFSPSLFIQNRVILLYRFKMFGEARAAMSLILSSKESSLWKVIFHDSFDVSFLMQILFCKPLKSCISLEKLELLCLSFCLSKRAYGEMRFSDSFAVTSLMHISNFPIFLM